MFAPGSAGAIAMVVQRLASATPGAVVLGRPAAATFPGIAYYAARNTVALVKTLRGLNPEFIDVHQQPRLAILLSYLFPATKILLFLHNDPLYMRGLKTPVSRRFALRRLHRVVCVSEYLKSRFMKRLTGPGPAVLPNPLTLAALPPAAETRRKNILFAGRIVRDKGPDTFIAACELALPKLPGWSATMMGGDRFGPNSPETPYVAQARAAALARGINFTGPRPHAEVLAALSEAAIAVVPSRWPEPFGLAALEAMACGAVLICTDQGGLPEVAGKVAVFVKADDHTELAAAMIAVARRDDSRPVLAAAGRERAAGFDTPLITAALEKLRQTV